MSFGWWTILDTHRKLLSIKNPCCSSWLKPVRLAPTNIPCSKGTYIFCLAHSPSEWHTYTIHVSIIWRFKNPFLTYLLPFIHTDWSGFNKWHQWEGHSFHLDSPGQSMSWKEEVFLIFSIISVFTCQHTWRSTVASTALSGVAPWCSQRTVIFRPPLGKLTSMQNLGGSWFSRPSIDLHSNMTTSGEYPTTYQISCSMNWHVVHTIKESEN